MNDLANELIKEVPNTAIPPTKKENKEEYLSSYKTEFSKAANDFWLKWNPLLLDKYTKGNFLGKHNTNTLEVFLKIFHSALYESIKQEILSKNKPQSILIKNYYDTLIELDKILISTLNTQYGKDIETDAILASLHGAMNSFIENTHKYESKMQNLSDL